MKFPILIKRKRVFIWYKDRWINIYLEATARGGGFKGFSKWLSEFLSCYLFGKHYYIGVFHMNEKECFTRRECAHCGKEEK